MSTNMSSDQMGWPPPTSGRSGLATAGMLLFALLVGGCGPTAEERMLQAAKRARPKSAAAVETADTAEAAMAEPATAAGGRPLQAQQAPVDPESEAQPESEPGATLQSIEDRRPAKDWSNHQRQKRSQENLARISDALQRYYEAVGTYPRSAGKTPQGQPSLSWRVTLLPYLGYDDLYKKFDLDKPWDSEPNRSLLPYIPDPFVSPERFDTRTNYLLPADPRFMFGQNRSPRFSQIEDGPDNTIMLVEVDDALAVPWTQPSDFQPDDWKDLGASIGKLRGDGAYALWANGRPVLLSNSLTADQLRNAFSYNAGDGLMASQIHQSIVAKEAQKSPAMVTSPTAVASASARQEPKMPADDPAPSRVAVPLAAEVMSAQRRLRAVYEDQLNSAARGQQKAELAGEFLGHAKAMVENDPAGAYALQTAALRLAAESGSAEELIRGVDLRVAHFDVDAYQENLQWMLAFRAGDAQGGPAGAIQGAFAQRAVQTLVAAVHADDYSRAAELAQHVHRQVGRHAGPKTLKRLEQLHNLLGAAHREFLETQSQVAYYRKDPNDSEAALTIGKFLCFYKGDWGTGLPVLAKGGGCELSERAAEDLQGASSVATQIAFADSWWSLGEQATTSIHRQGARDRAGHWYRLAFASLPESLDRLHVRARLDELEQAEPASPLAILMRLAEEVGADPSVTLAALATSGSPTSKYAGRAGRPSDRADEYD